MESKDKEFKDRELKTKKQIIASISDIDKFEQKVIKKYGQLKTPCMIG